MICSKKGIPNGRVSTGFECTRSQICRGQWSGGFTPAWPLSRKSRINRFQRDDSKLEPTSETVKAHLLLCFEAATFVSLLLEAVAWLPGRQKENKDLPLSCLLAPFMGSARGKSMGAVVFALSFLLTDFQISVIEPNQMISVAARDAYLVIA